MRSNLIRLTIGLLLVACFCLFGCGGGGDSSPPTGTLVITNSSAKTITGVYVSPTTRNTWGVNQISSPIYYGNSRTIVNIPVDTYDIKYTFSDGTSFVSPTTLVMTAGLTHTRTLTKLAAKFIDEGPGSSTPTANTDLDYFNISGEPGDPK